MLVTVPTGVVDPVLGAIEGGGIGGPLPALGGDIVIGGDLVHHQVVDLDIREGEEEEVLLGEVVKAVIEVVEVPLLIKMILIVEALVIKASITAKKIIKMITKKMRKVLMLKMKKMMMGIIMLQCKIYIFLLFFLIF
jgi:hypothetical protein